jgi:hypothetical protein
MILGRVAIEHAPGPSLDDVQRSGGFSRIPRTPARPGSLRPGYELTSAYVPVTRSRSPLTRGLVSGTGGSDSTAATWSTIPSIVCVFMVRLMSEWPAN